MCFLNANLLSVSTFDVTFPWWSQTLQHGVVTGVECFQFGALYYRGSCQDSIISQADAVGFAVIVFKKPPRLRCFSVHGNDCKESEEILKSDCSSLSLTPAYNSATTMEDRMIFAEWVMWITTNLCLAWLGGKFDPDEFSPEKVKFDNPKNENQP